MVETLAPAALPDGTELTRILQQCLCIWQAAELADRITIQWSARLRTTAGKAEYRHNRILLNPHLLVRVPDEVPRIVAHEAAHLVAHWRYGRRIRPHGPQWRELMYRAGYEPEVAHRYPVTGLRRRAFWYLHLCGRCGQRTILRRSRRMRCLQCAGRQPILQAKAPRSPAGYALLASISIEEVRRLEG